MVLVYILSNDSDSIHIKTVKNLFRDKYFTVSVINVVPEFKESKNQLYENYVEKFRVETALKTARQTNPDDFVIITKDTSVSVSTPIEIAKIIQKAVLDSGSFHLLYLCKWLDRCDLYVQKKQIENSSAIVTKTQYPNGIQSIMFSPAGRDLVLGIEKMKNKGKFLPTENLAESLTTEILKGNIEATAIVPNLINFNPTLAVKNSDYRKSAECDWNVGVKPGSENGSGAWTLFILALVLFLIIWAIYKLKGGYYSRR
jgi:hypothetical protein